jgi:threonine/homoserine/homoserine lactone efflux protein
LRRNASSQQKNNAMACYPLSPTFLKPGDSLAAVLIALAVFCVSVTLVVVIAYAFKRDHCLIKATSRELSAIILSGFSLLLIVYCSNGDFFALSM